MRLGNIISQQGGVAETGRRVKFQFRSKDKQGQVQRHWCEAMILPLSETERGEAEAAARTYAEQNPQTVLGDEAAYRKLQKFLRDPDDLRVCFFLEKEMDLLREGLVYKQVQWLLDEYQQHIEEEYPEILSEEEQTSLEEEAIKNS